MVRTAMRFTGELDKNGQRRVEECDLLLTSPARLRTLEKTGLMDTPREEAFDRLAHLAAQVLRVPLTLVSLVSDKKQFFKAAYGLPSPMDVRREIPIDGSICRYTLKGDPIIVADAATDPFLMHHPATKPWGIVAFIAIPMVMPNGHVLGAFCAVDSKVRPWSDEDILVMRELTASVMTEIDLRDRIRELDAERDLRERFVIALSHDLRTPLTAAKISAQLLGKKADQREDLRRLSVKIINSMDRADSMIRDLLDASLLKAGKKLSLEFTSCNLKKIATETLDELRVLHGERFVLRMEEPLEGECSALGIRRLLENLCGNAIKYGAHDRPVTVSIGRVNDLVKIAVHNEGPPIANADLPKLFDAFSRTISAQKSEQKGWGLGLTLVQGIAESHDGRVFVESSEANGTTFTVELHLKRA